jgi:hypothetical protein
MRSRCEHDIRLFAEYFFAHLLSRRPGRLHRELFSLWTRARSRLPLALRPGRRLAIAAPRGAAKSTLKTLLFPIHATLYQLERYIVILSATLKQARQRLRNIRSELETNAALLEYYPHELARWKTRTRDSLEVNDVRLDAYSAGTEIRGIAHRQWRPTLILLDDIEDSQAVRNPERRERLLQWYNEVIENIGDTYTAIEIVGTLLPPDSLLARLLARPDFQSRTFRSIEQFAERSDLWDQWRARFTNLDDPEREQTARDFFNRHRADMLRGARVLWQDKEDYYDLMIQLVTKGRAAFFKEKQNEPAAAQDAFCDLSRIIRFRLEGETLVILTLPG